MGVGDVSECLTITASVRVRADAGAVFAVVSDLRGKAALNPNIQVIRQVIRVEGRELQVWLDASRAQVEAPEARAQGVGA